MPEWEIEGLKATTNRLTKENEAFDKAGAIVAKRCCKLTEENEALKESSQQSFEWYQQEIKKNEVLKADNKKIIGQRNEWKSTCVEAGCADLNGRNLVADLKAEIYKIRGELATTRAENLALAMKLNKLESKYSTLHFN